MKNADKPALPTVDTIHPRTGERHEPINLGLTKREHFAALAMQGLSANEGLHSWDAERICIESVKMADELLKQLETK